MKVFLSFYYLLAFALPCSLSAQLNYSEVKGEVSIHNYSAISYENAIIGYNVAFKIKNKKETILSINFLDKNADVISRIDIVNADNLHIIETSYNGSLFAVLYLNTADKKLQTKMYSLKGIEVGNFEKPLNDNDLRYFTSKISQQAASISKNKFLHEINTQGFFLMYNAFEENLYTCNIYKIDTNHKSDRFYTYISDIPIFDSKFLGQKQNVLYFSFEKSGKTPHSFSADIVGLGINSFDQQFEITQNEKTDKVFIPESIVEGLEKNNPIIEGRFYFSNSEMLNQYHDGIALWEITSMGEVIHEVYNSFQYDFKDLQFNEKNKSSEVGYLFPHKAIGTKTGKIYVISEGYKKVADGPASIAPSFGYYGGMYYSRDYTKIKTTDIVISEFFENLKYRSSGVFEKHNNFVELGFYEGNSIYRIGDIFNRNGLFDYLFTEIDDENNSINVYFRNFNRNYTSAALMKVTKLSISRKEVNSHNFEKKPNTSETFFMPLSYGNLMIMEYINRKKTMYFDIRTMK